MGSFSIWHWLIVMAIVLLLFGGAGKIPKLMGDMAKGVKAFKQGLKDEEIIPSAPNSAPNSASTTTTSGALGQDSHTAPHQDPHQDTVSKP